MTRGHVAARPDDDGWFGGRWALTEDGRRASTLAIMRVILRTPPLWLAEQDAKEMIEYTLDDIASLRDGDPEGVAWTRHCLAALDRRLDRIRRKTADPA